MLKLATILQNPAEPAVDSGYSDPVCLRELGYNGLVLFETTGLSGVTHPDKVADPEIRRWVARQLDHIRHQIDRARDAKLSVYIFYDALSLARDAAENETATMCVNRPLHLCPASDRALELNRLALEGLLGLLPPVDGVVLRFGDNSAESLPHLIGNDIYSPRCRRCATVSSEDRICSVLDAFHGLVVEQLDKQLIARAWNVAPGGLHDSLTLCRAVADRLPGRADDPRFVLSFKFTHTDFWRYQPWNPCSLVFGNRPILYELQCQREFEGKGAMPNWQAPLWRDPAPEIPVYNRNNHPQQPADDKTGCKTKGGLAHVSRQIRWAGLWSWVRGGGWGGPFIENETWIDANVFAAPKLADDPEIQPAVLARAWINQRLGIHEPTVVERLEMVLDHSTSIVLKGFYIAPLSKSKKDPWNPNEGWIQDDIVDAQSAWDIIQALPDSVLDEVVHEKQEAMDQIATDRVAIQNLLDGQPNKLLEHLVNTLIYSESLLAMIQKLLAGLVAYRRFLSNHDSAQAQLCHRRLTSAQSRWNHHTQRHCSLPGAATAFREVHFWELTEKILQEVQPFTH